MPRDAASVWRSVSAGGASFAFVALLSLSGFALLLVIAGWLIGDAWIATVAWGTQVATLIGRPPGDESTVRG